MEDNHSQTHMNGTSEHTPLLVRHKRCAVADKIKITLLIILAAFGLMCGAYLLLREDGVLDPQPGVLMIIPRSSWGALETNFTASTIAIPARAVLLLQSNGSNCYSLKDCSEQMLNLQRHDMQALNQSDITVNFMVGGDGRTYEGSGWNGKSNSTSFDDGKTLVIGLLGNFKELPPTEPQLDQLTVLIDYAVSAEKITPCFTVSVYLQPAHNYNFLNSVAKVIQRRAFCV